eukprot:PhF_6_TR655/c0_g1_i1/m.951
MTSQTSDGNGYYVIMQQNPSQRNSSTYGRISITCPCFTQTRSMQNKCVTCFQTTTPSDHSCGSCFVLTASFSSVPTNSSANIFIKNGLLDFKSDRFGKGVWMLWHKRFQNVPMKFIVEKHNHNNLRRTS